MNKKFLGTALALLIGVAGTGGALAAQSGAASVGTESGTWYTYDKTVPGFNGSSTTDNKTKAVTEPATVESTTVGGAYTMDVMLEKSDGTNTSSWYTINDGTAVNLATSAVKGNSVHIKFSSDLDQTVNVRVTGWWSPDDNI